jgi:hypothetical protein
LAWMTCKKNDTKTRLLNASSFKQKITVTCQRRQTFVNLQAYFVYIKRFLAHSPYKARHQHPNISVLNGKLRHMFSLVCNIRLEV